MGRGGEGVVRGIMVKGIMVMGIMVKSVIGRGGVAPNGSIYIAL